MFYMFYSPPFRLGLLDFSLCMSSSSFFFFSSFFSSIIIDIISLSSAHLSAQLQLPRQLSSSFHFLLATTGSPSEPQMPTIGADKSFQYASVAPHVLLPLLATTESPSEPQMPSIGDDKSSQ